MVNRKQFALKASEYAFNSKFKSYALRSVRGAIKSGIKSKKGPSEVLKILKSKGLGYRKKVFLKDYARAQGTEYSLTDASYKRAGNWVEAVEKTMKVKKLKTRNAAAKEVSKYRNKATMTQEDIEEFRKIESELDDNIYGTSPKESEW